MNKLNWNLIKLEEKLLKLDWLKEVSEQERACHYFSNTASGMSHEETPRLSILPWIRANYPTLDLILCLPNNTFFSIFLLLLFLQKENQLWKRYQYPDLCD